MRPFRPSIVKACVTVCFAGGAFAAVGCQADLSGTESGPTPDVSSAPPLVSEPSATPTRSSTPASSPAISFGSGAVSRSFDRPLNRSRGLFDGLRGDFSPVRGDYLRARPIEPAAGAQEPEFLFAPVPADPDGSVVMYQAFGAIEGPPGLYELVRFNGKHTALLLPKAKLDSIGIARVRKMLDEQDIVYETLRELTGDEPAGGDLLTVAFIEETCGGGCGWLGSKGVEIMDLFLHVQDWIYVLVHEMIHNFDYVVRPLGSGPMSDAIFSGGDRGHAWTAGMDPFVVSQLAKGDNALTPDDAIKFHADERLGFYTSFPGHNFQTCIADNNCDPEGNLDATGLALFAQGGVILKVTALHGRQALRGWVRQAKSLIISCGLDPNLMTPAEKSDLLVESLGKAAGANISCYFDALNWPVSTAVRNALATYGTNANCVDSDGDGFTKFAGDCLEGTAAVRPGAPELAGNSRDDDCNGAVDETLLTESGDFPDDVASAQTVSLPIKIRGAVSGPPDPDHFKFTLASPTTVRFTFRSLDTLTGDLVVEWDGGDRRLNVDIKRSHMVKLALPAGTIKVFTAPEVTAGNYEILAHADYAWPLVDDFWSPTFTPGAATRLANNQFSFTLPPVPPALAGLPNLSAVLWSSRVGILGGLPAGSSAPFVWTAPAGIDADRLAYRIYYRSGPMQVHQHSQHQSLAGGLGWTSQDIGAIGPGGWTMNFGERDFTILGSGADIWGTADAFRYVHLPLNGDGVVMARVLQVQDTDPFAKGAVMIRENLTPGARNVLAGLRAGGEFTFQRRTTAGGTTVSTRVAALAPHWVKLARSGNVFTASRSPDGLTWTTVGSETIAMPAAAFAGLAVTSHNNAVLNTSSFDQAVVIPGPPGALPGGWSSGDIGSTGVAGSASQTLGAYTLRGSGADIYGTADAFRFAHRSLTGDGEITARVASLDNTHVWAKAGVMIRESLAANSKHAFMLVSAASGTAFQRRTSTGGSSTSTGGAGGAPMWVRLRRQGSTFTAFHSSDGITWESLGSQTISMTATVFMGLAVTSHNNGTLCQAVYDNVSAGALNPWTTTDLGAVSIPGSGGVAATTATLSASGADIWGTADAFTYLHRPLSGDGFLQARLTSQQPTHAWAKAGVMIRESLSPDSKHAFMVVSATSGTAFQRRTSTGGSTSSTGSTGAAPIWVRIERTGSTLTAKRSSDGVNWTTVGSASISMASNAFIGFAVTSHDNSVTSTAAFDNITAQE